MFRPVKDYTTRRIRSVVGTAEVRSPRRMLCWNCYPAMDSAFAPLKEICPDRATSELMELTAQLGSLMPTRQAAKVLADFLPIEPTETHATVRKRSIRTGERLNDQIMRETRRARSQTDDRCQLEMQLPGDRRKEFVISIDTAHVRCADPNSARSFELAVARCGRGGRGEPGGRYWFCCNFSSEYRNGGTTAASRSGKDFELLGDGRICIVGILACRLRIMWIISIPSKVVRALANDLKPSMDRTRRLRRR